MNFRERLERDRAGRMAANDNELKDGGEVCAYYGISSATSLPACVDLRFGDGGRLAIPYSYIQEIRFEAANEIIMRTIDKEIKIHGRDMERLYDFLAMFRVRFVKALAGDDFEESGLCVNEIGVTEIG